jgi:glutamyl-Q tRNA(Asp) synthetase
VLRQSERRPAYARALAALQAQGVLYPCFCTRKEIQAEIDSAIAAPHGAPSGPDGSLYPGTCRDMETDARAEKLAAGVGHALRLDAARAAGIVGALRFFDLDAGKTTVNPHLFGDAVIARKDIGTSYHLAVVVDDAHQGVSLVTRGADLAPATHLQRVLQGLLGLPAPTYRHHRLIADETGARLAKRADAASIKGLREAGLSPSEVRARAGFPD